MDPPMERSPRDEVMYLCSLWHQGPPRQNPNPNQRYEHHSNHAQLSQVHKRKIRKRGKRSGKGKKLPPISDMEWPCKELVEAPPLSSSGWPVFNRAKNQPVRLPTAEERIRFCATQLQQKALRASQEFFAQVEDSDGGEDSDDDDVDDDDMMEEDENAEFKFFTKLFEDDGELQGYYEKNCESGEFSCLVCGGIGTKVGKKFKNCVALVQHSVAIARTKKKKAHRAYAQVVCKVLGWDINRLPPVILTSENQPIESKGNTELAISNPSNCNNDATLVNADNGELALEEDSEDSDGSADEGLPTSTISETSNLVGDDVLPCNGNEDFVIGNTSIDNINSVLSNVHSGASNSKDSDVSEKQEVHNGTIAGTSNNAKDDMMLCESSLDDDDANKCSENIENRASKMDGFGVVTHLCRNVEKMNVLEA